MIHALRTWMIVAALAVGGCGQVTASGAAALERTRWLEAQRFLVSIATSSVNAYNPSDPSRRPEMRTAVEREHQVMAAHIQTLQRNAGLFASEHERESFARFGAMNDDLRDVRLRMINGDIEMSLGRAAANALVFREVDWTHWASMSGPDALLLGPNSEQGLAIRLFAYDRLFAVLHADACIAALTGVSQRASLIADARSVTNAMRSLASQLDVSARSLEADRRAFVADTAVDFQQHADALDAHAARWHFLRPEECADRSANPPELPAPEVP